MTPQEPAEGILLHRSFGDAKMYTVACECGGDDHNHQIWVEADDTGVNVSTSTTQKTDYWSEKVKKRYDIDNHTLQGWDWFWKDIVNGLFTRLRLTRDVWINGYVRYEATITMTEQQAINYSEVLKKAVADVKQFKQDSKLKP